MKWWQIVLIVLGVALAVLIAFGMWRESGARRKNIDDQVSRNGWSRADSDPGLLTRWEGEPFNLGRQYQATNVITGDYRGHTIVAFDLTFVARFGNQEHARHQYSVYAVSAGGATDQPQAARAKQLAAITTDQELAKRLTAMGENDRTFRLVGGDLLTWDLVPLEAYATRPGHLESRFALLIDVLDRIPPGTWPSSQ
ncbi:type III secretion system chaperone family protein [Flindersiella endophytica]